MLALNNGVPELLNLKRYLELFTNFRKDVVYKRTKYHLRKTREKAHILLGLSVALENIDKVIEIIRSSKDTSEAKEKLMKNKWIIPSDDFIKEFIKTDNKNFLDDGNFNLTESQAKSILEIKLSRLTGLERSKLINDLKDCLKLINEYLEILSSKNKLNEVIIEELNEIKDRIKSTRLTEISENEETIDEYGTRWYPVVRKG